MRQLKDLVSNAYETLSTERRVLEKTQTLLGVLGVYIVWFIGVIITIMIASRFDLIPISGTWMPIVSQLGLAVMVLVGVPYAIRSDEHLSVRTLFVYLGERKRKTLYLLSDIVTGVFLIIAVASWFHVAQRRLNSSVATIDWLYFGWFDIIGGITFTISIIFIVDRILQIWVNEDYTIGGESYE
jgi:TRAP-type C4-dicarboxylate transport system permease small subunit